MEWYWWAGAAIVAIVIANAVGRRRRPREENPLYRMVENVSTRNAAVREKLDEVTNLALGLQVRPDSAAGSANTLTRALLPGAIAAFLKEKLEVGWQTSTLMAHVASSPHRLTVVAKRRPDTLTSAARIFKRIAADTWTVDTVRVDDFNVAAERLIEDAESDVGAVGGPP